MTKLYLIYNGSDYTGNRQAVNLENITLCRQYAWVNRQKQPKCPKTLGMQSQNPAFCLAPSHICPSNWERYYQKYLTLSGTVGWTLENVSFAILEFDLSCQVHNPLKSLRLSDRGADLLDACLMLFWNFASITIIVLNFFYKLVNMSNGKLSSIFFVSPAIEWYSGLNHIMLILRKPSLLTFWKL